LEAEGRQHVAGARPGSAVRDDMAGRAEEGQRAAAGAIEKENRLVAEEARSRSENYRSTVRAGGIRSNHGDKPEVWDTVGANASAAELGAEGKPGWKLPR
jgi:hypothetical protein